jgi:hypothetical protein
MGSRRPLLDEPYMLVLNLQTLERYNPDCRSLSPAPTSPAYSTSFDSERFGYENLDHQADASQQI